jgi:hypothetical protein
MVLVAACSVFSLFSLGEEPFANAQLWKRLLRHTRTELVWGGVQPTAAGPVRVKLCGNDAGDGVGLDKSGEEGAAGAQ